MLDKIFELERRKKSALYIHIDEVVVDDSSHVFHIDLGSCTSVVLCGLDPERRLWIGIDHLFKPRRENTDVALTHVAELVNRLRDRGCTRIQGLGLFGAGYKKNSPAASVAQKNVMTILEALSIYDLKLKIFETGFIQGVTILKSDERDSVLIRHMKLENRESRIIEVPLAELFP